MRSTQEFVLWLCSLDFNLWLDAVQLQQSVICCFAYFQNIEEQYMHDATCEDQLTLTNWHRANTKHVYMSFETEQ